MNSGSPRIFSNHPTKDICGSWGNYLVNKKICLIMTSSVAIVNAPELARQLMRYGAEIFPVMTLKATELMGTQLIEWSTGNPVITELSGSIEHISIAGERENDYGFADLIVVYPATANTIGKMVHGISDNAATAILMVALGSKTPIMVIPAMHDSMFRNPIVSNNLQNLEKMGVRVFKPRMEENKAKIATPERIVENILINFSRNQIWKKKKVLITIGASREYLDPVRFISNPSTGKMGAEIAKDLLYLGADVTVIHGEQTISLPESIHTIKATSTADFLKKCKVQIEIKKPDLLISAAALADFTPSAFSSEKIRSDGKNLSVLFHPTEKLILQIRKQFPDIKIVGFKAESDQDLTKALTKGSEKLKSSNIDAIAVNQVSQPEREVGFGYDTNQITLIFRSGENFTIPFDTKINIARSMNSRLFSEFFQ